jgi:hypothetical protein
LRAGGKIVTRFSGNGNYALFTVVSKLPMAAARSIQIPSIVLDKFDDRANFHRRESSQFRFRWSNKRSVKICVICGEKAAGKNALGQETAAKAK